MISASKRAFIFVGMVFKLGWLIFNTALIIAVIAFVICFEAIIQALLIPAGKRRGGEECEG